MGRRIVLDTNVIVAGLRSRRGAAFRLLSLVGSEAFTHCLSVPLLFEYEDVLTRPGMVPLSADAIEDVLDGLCATAEQRPLYFLWRPQLLDASDDLVLEIAVTDNAIRSSRTMGGILLAANASACGCKRRRTFCWHFTRRERTYECLESPVAQFPP